MAAGLVAARHGDPPQLGRGDDAGWMNRMEPLARPAFACNHDLLMCQGAHGLAKQLDATPIAFDEYSGHRDRDDHDHGGEIPTTVNGSWKCANSVLNGREVVFVMASVAVYVRSSLRASACCAPLDARPGHDR
jgi:hypothetical protein